MMKDGNYSRGFQPVEDNQDSLIRNRPDTLCI
jgi:hypothetical protein